MTGKQCNNSLYVRPHISLAIEKLGELGRDRRDPGLSVSLGSCSGWCAAVCARRNSSALPKGHDDCSLAGLMADMDVHCWRLAWVTWVYRWWCQGECMSNLNYQDTVDCAQWFAPEYYLIFVSFFRPPTPLHQSLLPCPPTCPSSFVLIVCFPHGPYPPHLDSMPFPVRRPFHFASQPCLCASISQEVNSLNSP